MQVNEIPPPYYPYPYRIGLIQQPAVRVIQVQAQVMPKPEKPPQRRLKIVRWFKSTVAYVKQYFQYSNLHGFPYVVKRGLTLFEHFLWLILLIICIYLLIRIGLQSVDRYYNKSTVVGIERDYYYWNTSLPSLTVCPLQRLNKTLVDEYCSLHNIAGERKEEFAHFMEQLANSTYMNFGNIPDYPSIDATLAELNIKPEHYMQLIYNLTTDNALQPNQQKRIICIDGKGTIHVRQVLTEFGLCYLTNSYFSDQVTSRYLIFGEYPEENTYNSTDRFLKVLQTPFPQPAFFSFKGFTGDDIYIYIHGAHELMRIDNNFYYIDGLMTIFPEVLEMKTEEGFEKGSTISQRKCRFQHESNLTHFPLYSKNICLQECRLNLAYDTCHCIPHFYPNRISNPKPVCSYKVLKKCFPEHETYFIKLFRTDCHEVEDDCEEEPDHEGFTCQCMQNCEEEIVTIRDAKIESGSGAKDLFGGVGAEVKLESWPRGRLIRQIIYSFTDLLVSIGGTAGLFLGVSVLGAVEILYFFTLRLICYLCGYN